MLHLFFHHHKCKIHEILACIGTRVFNVFLVSFQIDLTSQKYETRLSFSLFFFFFLRKHIRRIMEESRLNREMYANIFTPQNIDGTIKRISRLQKTNMYFEFTRIAAIFCVTTWKRQELSGAYTYTEASKEYCKRKSKNYIRYNFVVYERVQDFRIIFTV